MRSLTPLPMLILVGIASCATADPIETSVAEEVKPFLEKRGHVSLGVGIATPAGKRHFGFGTAQLDGKDRTPDEHALYEIGSITKVLTGTLLAQLVLERKVKLDDPAQPLLPVDWKLPRRDERDITLLHLATHTSSLPVQPPALGLLALAAGSVDDPYAKFDSTALAKTLGSIRLERAIGSKHAYSNLGVGLLGHALARADGRESYEALLSARLFKPLRMNDSAIRPSEEQWKKLAPGHDKSGKPVSGWHFATLEACCGVRSSVHDMTLFLAAAMASDGDLKPAFALAQQPWRELPQKGVEIGLCWMRTDSDRGTLLWHNGGTGGYASFLGFRPKSGMGVVVLCNGADRAVDRLGMTLLERLEK